MYRSLILTHYNKPKQQSDLCSMKHSTIIAQSTRPVMNMMHVHMCNHMALILLWPLFSLDGCCSIMGRLVAYVGRLAVDRLEVQLVCHYVTIKDANKSLAQWTGAGDTLTVHCWTIPVSCRRAQMLCSLPGCSGCELPQQQLCFSIMVS